MSALNKYKAIIFDWDGTLVDTCGLILKAHNFVRETFGEAVWTMEDFLGTASKSAREYYPEVYGERSDEAQTVLYDFVEKHHIDMMKPMDNAKALIDFIKNETDMHIGVVSNKRHKTLLKEAQHLGWHDHFDCFIGAGIAAKDKPSPDPLLMGMADISEVLRPDNVLYIGDTETDLLTAKNTGCDIVFIQSDSPRPDLIEKYSPTYSFMSTNAFYCFIQSEFGQKTSEMAEKKAC